MGHQFDALALDTEARALLAVLVAAAAHGRLTHDEARRASGLNAVRYPAALGQLEQAGALLRLIVGPRMIAFTLAGGAQ